MADNNIQIDMFEVQLGAAILLQFRTDSQTIRVLADAGVHGAGYPVEWVHNKLGDAFRSFGDEDRHIDLVIGTHYDADHLEGLVPILQDETIAIRALWLPPTENDVEVPAADDPVTDTDLLAIQFADENGDEWLERYVAVKERDIEELDAIIANPDGESLFRSERTASANEASWRKKFGSAGEAPDSDRALLSAGLRQRVGHLRSRLAALNSVLGDHEAHGAQPVSPDLDFDEDPPFDFSPSWRRERLMLGMKGRREQIVAAREAMADAPQFAPAWTRSIAHMQRASVKQAINATSLYKVVAAAKGRTTPLLPQCEIIEEGVPRRFVWNKAQERFIGSKRGPSDGPVLTLLGPSRTLVVRHRRKLPQGEQLLRVLTFRNEVKGITESNQLSYVVRAEHLEQGILISGDTGFNDFKIGRRPFFKALLDALLPLHVVQVAHHGGANYNFYNALAEARFPEQKAHAYLLLSHATQDPHRPSREFKLFIEEVRGHGDDVSLLFTCQPRREKVEAYRDLIAPATAAADDRGDVRLHFDGQDWKVDNHLIHVP